MKTIVIIIFLFATLSLNGNSQIFVSDSICRYNESTYEVIEAMPDTSYTIERSFRTINVKQQVEGNEKQWTINIEEKTLAIRRGNVKSQTIKGILWGYGYRQLATVGYNLVDLNDDKDYEVLEYIMREGRDVLLYIYCHKK